MFHRFKLKVIQRILIPKRKNPSVIFQGRKERFAEPNLHPEFEKDSSESNSYSSHFVFGKRGYSTEAKIILKTAPFPCSDSTLIPARLRSRICLLKLSPIPLPSALVEKNGTNILSI